MSTGHLLALVEAQAELNRRLRDAPECPASTALAAAALGRELVALADAQLRPAAAPEPAALRRHAIAAAAHALRLAACITVEAYGARAAAPATTPSEGVPS